MSKPNKTQVKDEEIFQKELEKAYINITKDGGVKKLIAVEGDGPIPKAGEKVAVHYTVLLEDGTIVGDTFDRKYPLKLTVGGEASIKGVELAIATMRYGEKVRLEITPQYGFGAMDNVHGFHGYGVRIPPNSKLMMELHLLPLDLALPKTTSQWVEQAETNKTNGNNAFGKNDNETAQNEYENALKILESVKKQLENPINEDGKSEEEKNKLREEKEANKVKCKELLITCHSNLAAVYLRTKKYELAKEQCKLVLEQDPKHVKAHYRLALAHKELSQYETAIEHLTTAAEINNSKDIQKELAECKKLHKERLSRDSEVYGGMFNKLKKGEALYEGVQPGKAEKWKCHYCGDVMDEIQRARHIIKMHTGEKKEKITNKDLGLPDQIPLDIAVKPLKQ